MSNIPDHQTLGGYVQAFQDYINSGDIQNAWNCARYLMQMPLEFDIQVLESQISNPLPIYGVEVNQKVYEELKDIGYDNRTCILGATGTFSVEDAIKKLKQQLIQ